MDNFLEKTIILKPENLQLKLNKSDLSHHTVIQISPEFKDQPVDWLPTFDRYSSVQDEYHIAEQDGSVTHIIIDPNVKTVLEAIKRMPGRKIAGDNALAFIKNPYTILGEDSHKVIDETTFVKEVKSSGIRFHQFYAEPILNHGGTRVLNVLLELIPVTDGDEKSKFFTFNLPGEFLSFLNTVNSKRNDSYPCCFWKEYELELTDVSEEIMSGLNRLAFRWQDEVNGKVFEDVLDLTQYGSRVIGIGVAPLVNSPYIGKEQTEDWISLVELNELGFDVEILSKWDDASYVDFAQFNENIEEAKKTGSDSVIMPGLELQMPLKKAELVSDLWEKKFANKEQLDGVVGEENFKKIRSVLLLGDNIESVEYVEKRAEILSFDNSLEPLLPTSLKSNIQLMEHQRFGVAWLQNLLNKAPDHVSGCLLADDMGLGKTIQLLAFILSYLEFSNNPHPCLIVAPVSLLDNWENELHKFFDADHIEIKKLYGKVLSESKYKKEEIPADLRNKGINNLLRAGWIGNSKIILTTYETLRDQQFSLAQQQWGIVVCDEAQKIKTPGTLVTDAAKAVAAHAKFKVACTGTPVENTLVDLWCLFEFFQAGFLGSLNEFARNFKKPIECKTDSDQFALNRLRELIEPQILRRLKSDVAKDLPAKIEEQSCKSLLMSATQNNLYISAISDYEHKKQIREQMGSKAGAMMLGLLHRLKMICAHPVSVILSENSFDSSPKLHWIKNQLDSIKAKSEKVIIFTELKDIQRELQIVIQDNYDFIPKIINGDTNTSSEKGASRQKLIDEFQSETGFGVIILSTSAVGFGVNVQAANHVIHFTRPWNPAKEDQATDRAYRIGQTKDVHVYYPTVVSNSFASFEKKLDGLLSRKRELAGDMLNGYGEIAVEELVDVK